MIVNNAFLKFTIVVLTGLFLTTAASANMLIKDLTSLKFSGHAQQDWKVRSHHASEIQLECVNCVEHVLLHIKLGKRIDFGDLGLEAARKAKTNCNRSISQSLQCDTVKGFKRDNVDGLLATVKILEDFFISTIVLGDDTSLLKITTKASSKLVATQISNEFFKTASSMLIVK